MIDAATLTDAQRLALDDVERPVTVSGDESPRRGKAGMAHAFTCAGCGRLLASDDQDALRAAASRHVERCIGRR